MTAWSDNIVLCTDGAAMLSATEQNSSATQWQSRSWKSALSAWMARAGSCARSSFAVALDSSARRSSSIRRAAVNQSLRKPWDVSLLATAASSADSTKQPASQACSSPATSSRMCSWSIVAAAEGTRAAFGINRALTREDFDRRATGSRRVQHPSLEIPPWTDAGANMLEELDPRCLCTREVLLLCALSVWIRGRDPPQL